MDNKIIKNVNPEKSYSEKYTILKDPQLEKYTLKFYLITILFCFLGLGCFLTGFIGIIMLIYCNYKIKIILILFLIYQYFFLKQSPRLRNFIAENKSYLLFYDYKLVLEEELQEKNSLFAYHPHGIISLSAHFSFSKHEYIRKSTWLASRAMVTFPFCGIFAKLLNFEGVDKNNFLKHMKTGSNISFTPGGFEEATITDYRRDRVYIKSRKGFIKYGLQYGYKLYPVYSFGENKLYYTVNIFEKFRLFLNRIKLPGVIFYSPYMFFSPIPNKILTTVIGKPIELPLIQNPDEEMINKYHKIYIEELVNLYNRHKGEWEGSETLEVL